MLRSRALIILLLVIIIVCGLVFVIHFISKSRPNSDTASVENVDKNTSEVDSVDKLYKDLVKKLKQSGKTVSTMESCTGGSIANSITNAEGASSVFQFGAVTYSNEYKIKMGVDPEIIEKYTVYSMETAKEMSLKISSYTGSDFGIGVTGKLNRVDTKNPYGEDNKVYISVYDRFSNQFYTEEAEAIYISRDENKRYIAERAVGILNEII